MRSQRKHPLLLALVCLLALPLIGRAQMAVAAFEAANKLYEEGKYSDAASAYRKILQSGDVSAAVWFNLGNACFKSSQIGHAIAAYAQAKQLAPRDPDVRANLQFARNQVSGPTLMPSRWQQWLGQLRLNEWATLAAGAFWLEFLLLGLRQWLPTLKSATRGLVIAIGVAVLVTAAGLTAAWRQTRVNATAIVIARETTVHAGPLPESPTAFKVNDGAELRVLDRKDQWLQVGAGSQRIGWVRQDEVLLSPQS
jgi:tetratricopeptide (TPR) repeat protein